MGKGRDIGVVIMEKTGVVVVRTAEDQEIVKLKEIFSRFQGAYWGMVKEAAPILSKMSALRLKEVKEEMKVFGIKKEFMDRLYLYGRGEIPKYMMGPDWEIGDKLRGMTDKERKKVVEAKTVPVVGAKGVIPRKPETLNPIEIQRVYSSSGIRTPKEQAKILAKSHEPRFQCPMTKQAEMPAAKPSGKEPVAKVGDLTLPIGNIVRMGEFLKIEFSGPLPLNHQGLIRVSDVKRLVGE